MGTFDNGDWVMVRGKDSGVFLGKMCSRQGQEVVLRDVRRIWFWKGAATLSQLAQHGTSLPKECKFPCKVTRVTILDAIEILPVTEQARRSIDEVPEWRV